MSLTLLTMTTLYSGKVGLSRLFAVITVIFLFTFSVSFGLWWAAGRSAGAESVASSLISNSEVRAGVAEKLVDQVTSGADADVKKIVSEKRAELIQAVSNALADPSIKEEALKIVDQVYAFYTGETKDANIDVKVLIDPILKSMAAVDPAFKVDKVDANSIEPIQLDESTSKPDIGGIKSLLAIVVFGSFLILVLSIFGVAKYSRTKNSFVGVIGWEFTVIGILLLAIFFGGTAASQSAASAANDPLVTSAVPVVAQTFLGMFRLSGVLLLIVGLIGIVTWARTRKAPQAQ